MIPPLNVKVVVLTVDASMGSLNVAKMGLLITTDVAVLAGLVNETVGDVVSGVPQGVPRAVTEILSIPKSLSELFVSPISLRVVKFVKAVKHTLKFDQAPCEIRSGVGPAEKIMSPFISIVNELVAPRGSLLRETVP